MEVSKKLITFGSKKIYLPKFTVALVRAKGLSPYHARFLVPLDFSKFDLRDYLYHAYNIRCFNIRSNVKQMPVRDTAAQPRHWFRPESKKYMTVEMEEPFVWPEVPDLTPWGKEERESEIARSLKANHDLRADEEREAARILREQARVLLEKRVDQNAIEKEIARKKSQNIALTKEEMEQEALRQKEEERIASLPTVRFWERQRTAKVVEADSGDFTIKA